MVVLLQGSRHCASCIYVSAHDFIDAPAEVMYVCTGAYFDEGA